MERMGKLSNLINMDIEIFQYMCQIYKDMEMLR